MRPTRIRDKKMKRLIKFRKVNVLNIVLSAFVLLAAICFGTQNTRAQQQEETNVERQERTAINVGVLMGGGSLIGADFEYLIGKRFGVQLGAGFGSMGFGVNYHFKPYINSQFVSLQYWQQGFGENHYASYFGPMYNFRARKLFQFGIGFGSILSTGPGWEKAWENKKNEPTNSAALLYNIGLYFSL